MLDINIFSLAIEEIEERVKNKNIVPTLISQPEEFAERMRTSIYPDLDGTDHTTLIYYFTLLAGVGDVKQGGITADNHLKLLKKLKGVAIGKFERTDTYLDIFWIYYFSCGTSFW